MKEIFEGAKKFSKEEYLKYKKLFFELEQSQSPHTLYIGCCDSRVNPNLITSTLPGELFIIRNVANVVPDYSSSMEHTAVSSAIEYAVVQLNVESIVVCGHSNCGGCRAKTMAEDELVNLPAVKSWIKKIPDLNKNEFDIDNMDDADIQMKVEKNNIVEQINNLLTYPYIKSRYDEKKINLLGWYFEIKTGNIYNYNFDKKLFEEIE